MDEDVMLKTEWQATHEDLKTQVRLENSDSGSFWAGLFIARLIKAMQMRRKYRTKKTERISEFNKRKEYSKMLRRIEEEDRIEEEVVAIKKARAKINKESEKIMQQYARLKKVKFANE